MRMLFKLCEITVLQVRFLMSELRRYSELIQIPDFTKRYEYLALHGRVGADTFGFDRYFNQKFYQSKEWQRIRRIVIARDNGCDLAHPDHLIPGQILIHHMNTVSLTDIQEATDILLNPEFMISTSLDTHNAIHYGDKSLLHEEKPIVRTLYDTSPWRKANG